MDIILSLVVIVHREGVKKSRFSKTKSNVSQIIHILFVTLAKWKKLGYNVPIP